MEMTKVGRVLAMRLHSTTLTVEGVHDTLLWVVETPLWEVLFRAVLVFVLLKWASCRPFVDVVDEVLMPEAILFANAEELAKHLVVVEEAASGEGVEEAREREWDVWQLEELVDIKVHDDLLLIEDHEMDLAVIIVGHGKPFWAFTLLDRGGLDVSTLDIVLLDHDGFMGLIDQNLVMLFVDHY